MTTAVQHGAIVVRLKLFQRTSSRASPALARARLRHWIAKTSAEQIFDVSFDSTAQAVVFALPNRDALGALWPAGQIRLQGETVPIQSAIHRQRFTGTHDPIGVFIAAGGPIAPRAVRDRLSVLDIAPLLFYAAGQPVPDDLEGSVGAAWIRAEHWTENPPQTVSLSNDPPLSVPGETPSEEDPALIREADSARSYRMTGW